MSRDPAKYYFGALCEKHPSLSGERLRSNWRCVECGRERKRAWAAANKPRVAQYNRDWASRNPDLRRSYNVAEYTRNPGRLHAFSRRWHEENPSEAKAHEVRWRAKRREAVPAWADHARINCLYQLAAAYRAVGIDAEVDHIVPLQSRRVSGLHCEANLTLLPRAANRSKGNRHWPGAERQNGG